MIISAKVRLAKKRSTCLYLSLIPTSLLAFVPLDFSCKFVPDFMGHQRFLWWTLYPTTYPLASSLNWTMSWMWSSIFTSWLLKRVVLKHGGCKAYRRAIPFSFDLIFGDYLVGGIWNVWGVLSHRYIYTLLVLTKSRSYSFFCVSQWDCIILAQFSAFSIYLVS